VNSWCNAPWPSRNILIRVAACALCLCGFRLAGSYPRRRQWPRPLSVAERPYTDSRAIRPPAQEFRRHAAACAPAATATVEVTQVWSANARSRVGADHPTEYELTYTVPFTCAAPTGVAPLHRQQPVVGTSSFGRSPAARQETSRTIRRQQMARDWCRIAPGNAPADAVKYAGVEATVAV